MQEAHILLVEGRSAGEQSWAPALHKVGYTLCLAHTGTAAVDLLKTESPDLIIFDASTMRSSGSRSCRRLRRLLPDIPLIHSRSAKTPKDESIEADVYLARPYTSRKLLNRVRALLPADGSQEEVVRCGHLTFYRAKRSVDVNGQGEQQLTPKLAQLLEEFFRYPNQVISRRQLMQNVWNTDYVGDTRTLDVHIRWMREHIEADPAQPRLLRTVRGKGYIFNMEPDAAK
ncbi:MAG: response regulator transcription factor [Chloroflexota bacterium]|jgi:DNA-binding response OmpR family regulator